MQGAGSIMFVSEPILCELCMRETDWFPSGVLRNICSASRFSRSFLIFEYGIVSYGITALSYNQHLFLVILPLYFLGLSFSLLQPTFYFHEHS